MHLNRIMLVDDEPDIRTVAELALSSVGGWEVVLATSGEDALDKLKSDRPDIVLLDVMMPDMDGPTVLRRIREQKEISNVPVIFMTAKVQKREVDHYLELGACGVIGKPFDPMQLPEQIREILHEL